MLPLVPRSQPVFDRALAEFAGSDPWTGQQAAPWVLGLYRLENLIPAKTANAGLLLRNDELPAGFILGLFARHSNEVRMLPYSLGRQWQQGGVEAEDLAPLLFRAERMKLPAEESYPAGLNYRRLGIVLLATSAPLAAAVLPLRSAGFVEVALGASYFAAIFGVLGIALFVYYVAWLGNQQRLGRQWREFRAALRRER